eukprot:SAG31_NODE_6293_length_2079_cov_1.852525_2_plen_355_part_00
MRVIVVGVGSIGRRHARLLCARSSGPAAGHRVEVELCEPSAAMLALAVEEGWAAGLPVHATFQDALGSKPDAMVLCTPHSVHAEQAIAALDAGVHVLTEKPLCATLVEAEEIRAAAAKSTAVLAVGYTLHYHPVLRKAREMVSSGELGTLVHIHWHIGSLRTLMNSKSNYQEHLLGALILDYAHQPDNILWMCSTLGTPDRPVSVYAAGSQLGSLPKTSNPNAVALVYTFASGMLATVNLNYVQHPDTGELTIIGDKGWLSVADLSAQPAALKIGKIDSFGTSNEMAMDVIELPYDRDDMFKEEHSMFLACCVGDRAKPETTVDDAVVTQQMIVLGTQSWESGQPVRFPSAMKL